MSTWDKTVVGVEESSVASDSRAESDPSASFESMMHIHSKRRKVIAPEKRNPNHCVIVSEEDGDKYKNNKNDRQVEVSLISSSDDEEHDDELRLINRRR